MRRPRRRERRRRRRPLCSSLGRGGLSGRRPRRLQHEAPGLGEDPGPPELRRLRRRAPGVLGARGGAREGRGTRRRRRRRARERGWRRRRRRLVLSAKPPAEEAPRSRSRLLLLLLLLLCLLRPRPEQPCGRSRPSRGAERTEGEERERAKRCKGGRRSTDSSKERGLL